MTAVGILGLGTYLPPEVRRNDWWPSDVVARWSERSAARVTRGDSPDPGSLAPGERRTLEAMVAIANDPFRGAVERRVIADDMTQWEMEARAAREAMQRAGIRPDEVGVLLTQTPIPEHLVINTACPTHRLLELPRRCFTLGTEAACNGFALHASLAQAMIASGQAKYVLSVHSTAMTRVNDPKEPDSAWWGDGAAAAVFGAVSDGRGLLSAVHNTDGNSWGAVVLGVPDRRWWEDGRMVIHNRNRDHTRAMLMSLVDRAGETIGQAIDEAGLTKRDVDFFASHQGTAWLTKATQAHSGLDHAKTLVTFPTFGNMTTVNIPFILAMAEREGMVRDGSIVATFSGGAGETWSSLCLRWGR